MGTPLTFRYFSGMICGPPSMGRPKPSKTRPTMSGERPISRPLPVKRTWVGPGLEAAGALEDLHEDRVLLRLEDLAAADGAVGELDLGDLPVADPLDAADEDQRADDVLERSGILSLLSASLPAPMDSASNCSAMLFFQIVELSTGSPRDELRRG